MQLSKVPDGKVRLIVDDCMKFIQREERRSKKYDGIVMDPPSFGRGASGEVWKLEKDLWDLLIAYIIFLWTALEIYFIKTAVCYVVK